MRLPSTTIRGGDPPAPKTRRDMGSEPTTTSNYDFHTIERMWQERWESDGIAHVDDTATEATAYVLEMLPYPSGDLHVGHAKNYTLGDAIARMRRMLGERVLHPMGWDAFGLPAENAAIKRGIDPEQWTRANIANMRRQVRSIGTSYDWRREFATCDPTYYRWNQSLFLRLYRAGLAYRREAPVNWCPTDQTVLANEQVEDGRCWRCDSPVERRLLSQWFLRITAYADRLLEGLDRLPGWPERIKTMQRNWIGRSEGATLRFAVDGIADAEIAVYTTRPDTLFGVTALALAAEHPLIERLLEHHPAYRTAVTAFAESLTSKSELERTSLMEKSGLFTGAYALHPLSGERIPIWVTNYVLAEYGTGAVMSVPAHDERDFAFAQTYKLPIRYVVIPEGETEPRRDTAFVEDGILTESGPFSGMSSSAARTAITAALIETGRGERSVNYRVRDWLISRQRYWGTPIPMVHCPTDGLVAVPESQLPVVLPLGIPITGEGSPLAHDADFRRTTCPQCGGPAERETDTMDTFVDSSWYYLRYLDATNAEEPFCRAHADRWMPVDQYIGGAEHAVMHLLYARFFFKVLFDHGLVGCDEPFTNLFNQGMVLANGEKMSKSRGNVVGIDETVEEYGVDAMRLYLLKAAPPEETMNWTTEGIVGRVRFLNRAWRLCEPFFSSAGTGPLDTIPDRTTELQRTLVRALHEALRSGAEETTTRRFHYNVTTARLDELLNALSAATRDESTTADDAVINYVVHALPIVLAPFAPHLADELWHRMGHTDSVHRARWITPDPAALAHETITLVVQVNGKVRARLTVSPTATESEIARLALAEANVVTHLAGKSPRKQIYVPGKLFNLVVAPD